MTVSRVMGHLTQISSSPVELQHSLQSSEAAFADGKLKVFDPQRGEAILKTTDVADNINASVRGAGARSAVRSHWTRVSSFAPGVGRRIFSS